MAATDEATAGNGHIEVDSYTINYGHTKVRIIREGAGWLVRSQGGDSFGARFPDGDHQAMMSTAVEYAKRLDEADRRLSAAQRDRDDVHRWLAQAQYRPDEKSAGASEVSE